MFVSVQLLVKSLWQLYQQMHWQLSELLSQFLCKWKSLTPQSEWGWKWRKMLDFGWPGRSQMLMWWLLQNKKDPRRSISWRSNIGTIHTIMLNNINFCNKPARCCGGEFRFKICESWLILLQIFQLSDQAFAILTANIFIYFSSTKTATYLQAWRAVPTSSSYFLHLPKVPVQVFNALANNLALEDTKKISGKKYRNYN